MTLCEITFKPSNNDGGNDGQTLESVYIYARLYRMEYKQIERKITNTMQFVMYIYALFLMLCNPCNYWGSASASDTEHLLTIPIIMFFGIVALFVFLYCIFMHPAVCLYCGQSQTFVRPGAYPLSLLTKPQFSKLHVKKSTKCNGTKKPPMRGWCGFSIRLL